jgi:hypothetical protein
LQSASITLISLSAKPTGIVQTWRPLHGGVHLKRAAMSAIGGKATAGGLPLQISPRHAAFLDTRFPARGPGKLLGSGLGWAGKRSRLRPKVQPLLHGMRVGRIFVAKV